MRCALTLVVVLWSAPALAQVPPDADRARAAELYREAYATAESNPGLAIDTFRRSYALDPRPQTLYALGQLEIQVGLLADAFGHLTRLLASPGNLEPQRVSSARRLLDRLRPRVSFVALEITPEGATITLDERPIGAAPVADPIPIDPGTHEVRVEAPHHESASTRVECAAGATARVVVSLVRIAPGTIEIAFDPPPTSLLVDRTEVAPAQELTLEAGTHEIELRRAEHRSVRRRIELAPGARVRLTGRLPLLVEPARISVRSPTPGSQLRIDDRDADLPFSGPLAPGRHVLRLSAEGFVPAERALTLRPGEARSLVLPLREVPISENPWLWAGIGAGALAIAAVILAVVLTQPRDVVLQPIIDAH